MRGQKDANSVPKKSQRLLAGCIGVPLLLLVGAGILYTFNNRKPLIDIPTPVMPSQNAYDDFVKAGRLAKNMTHKSPYSIPGPPAQTCTLANFAAAAKDAEPALALLRQGLNKPYQSPPVRSYKVSIFPNYALFRELARTVAGVSTYEELTGHPGKAIDTSLDGMEMGVMVPHGGATISSLVGIACEAIAGRKIERLLPQLSPQELAHAAERLDKIAAKRTHFADIELEEGYSTTAEHLEELNDRSEKGLNNYHSARNLLMVDEETPLTWKQRGQILRFLMTDKTAMLRANLDYYKARAEEAKKPYTGKSAVPAPDNLLAYLAVDIDNVAQVDILRCEAIGVILQVEVALYRFKADHDVYPTSLRELTPTYLKSLPDDPFGGKSGVSLRYQAQESGWSFLLYSIGPDMQDNGGQPQAHYGNDPGDIVATKIWPAATSRY